MMTFAGEEVFMRGLMQTSTTTICGEVGGGVLNRELFLHRGDCLDSLKTWYPKS